MEEKELSWLAAIIDCDGCIGASLIKPSTITVRVALTNTSKLLLNNFTRIIKELCGGTTHLSFVCRTGKNKICYNCSLQKRRDVLRLLKTLYPFLIEKKQRAKLMIDYLSKELITIDGNTQEEKLKFLKDIKELNYIGESCVIIKEGYDGENKLCML